MVHVRKAEINEIVELCEDLVRYGKELMNYGMIGYGDSISGRSMRIRQIVKNARD